MHTESTELRSRWGFHPCNYELFLKLKRLHKWYWQTVYDFYRWHRWWRKQPQNRRGPEPAYCAVLVEKRMCRVNVPTQGEDCFELQPAAVVDECIVELYHAARMPQGEPVEPFDAETKRRIESLYEQIGSYFNSD